MRKDKTMSRGAWFLVVVLVGLLALAAVFAVRAWNVAGDASGMDSQISLHGGIALLLGAFGTIALGAGLMALVFLSHRSGHDEAVHEEHRDRFPEMDDDGR